MSRRDKWLWALTLANLVTGVLLVVVICAMGAAAAAFAVYIPGWPLFIVLAVGLPSSVIGVLLARRAGAGRSRTIGCVANAGTLALHSLVALTICAALFFATKERFVIPEGYRGNVYVIHSVPDGKPEEKTTLTVTYHIPVDGILRTRSAPLRGLTWSRYYYERADATLQRLQHLSLTSIHRTPENMTNDRDVGVFLPRAGSVDCSQGRCRIEYQKFYVGTTAHLLSGDHERDLCAYLREHPVKCDGQDS